MYRGVVWVGRAGVLAAAVVGLVAGSPARSRAQAPDPPGTFSIIAFDSASGQLGGAVQSRVFSVGNGVLWAEAGVGIVATQAIVDVSYGPQALALLREGKAAAEVVKTVWERDPDPDSARWTKQGRQFAVVDAKGNVAAFTGPRASAWAARRWAAGSAGAFSRRAPPWTPLGQTSSPTTTSARWSSCSASRTPRSRHSSTACSARRRPMPG